MHESRGLGDVYKRQTYGRLRELAEMILEGGYHALVDATFLEQAQRRPFLDLAAARGCPCVILVPEAPEAVLRERVSRRHVAGGDPSEADLAILASQLASREPLTGAEERQAVRIDTVNPPSVGELLGRLGV